MLTCFDVADYFLAHCDEESGDIISNLKIQKLTYYAQGFSLVLLGKPLFNEKIEAWMHGPVVPELYRKYRDCGNGALPAPENFDAKNSVKMKLNCWMRCIKFMVSFLPGNCAI